MGRKAEEWHGGSSENTSLDHFQFLWKVISCWEQWLWNSAAQEYPRNAFSTFLCPECWIALDELCQH